VKTRSKSLTSLPALCASTYPPCALQTALGFMVEPMRVAVCDPSGSLIPDSISTIVQQLHFARLHFFSVSAMAGN
jgi:hypothetical protein